jgi:hypothetical protein
MGGEGHTERSVRALYKSIHTGHALEKAERESLEGHTVSQWGAYEPRM